MHFPSRLSAALQERRAPVSRWGAFLLLSFAFFGLRFPARAQPNAPPALPASGSRHFIQLKGADSGSADAFAETPELIKLGPGGPYVAPTGDGQAKTIPVRYYHRSPKAQGKLSERDPVIQSFSPALNTPGPTTSFDGIANIDGYVPPDTVGAIGPSNYVQAVNVRVQVFDRFTGAPQTAANPISSLFAGLGSGSLCATTDDGDPIVLYDPYADRWLIAQFANADSRSGPFYMSIAISKTSDPTGAYYAYCFQLPGSKFPDYPKFGVWPDAYYLSVNQFNNSNDRYAGAGVYAFDRRKMLAGDPAATFNYFDLANVDINMFGFLPASADGPPPPVGAPDYFMFLQGTSLGDSANQLRLFQFHADFQNSANASFTERPDSPVAVAAYTAFSPSTLGIPQSGTSQDLDSLGDRLMFRLQYRNFGSNESLVVTHTVNGGSGQAAIRYYQLKRPLPGGSFSIPEQATYAPDNLYRWMGSVAVNNVGALAVGYSVSSSTTFPSIRYAARLATDPPNGLFQGEAILLTGTGAQTDSTGRWGDYSCMTIDPVDDSTFWYTQEYIAVTGLRTWRTRIGSFSLPGSTPAPRASLHGIVFRAGDGAPVTNAILRTSTGYVRTTGNDGSYSFFLFPGTSDLFVEAPGIGTNQLLNLVLTNGEDRLLNFALPAPVIVTNSFALLAESCPPGNGAIDPGESVTISLGLKNIGFANTTNLVVTLLATNGVSSPSSAQTYGVLSTNGAPFSAPFSFAAVGNCGGLISPTFLLQDGASSLGALSLTLPLGATGISPWENFDAVSSPAIPSGWSTTATGAQSAWVTTTTVRDTTPNSVFSPDPAAIGVNELLSPVTLAPASQARLSFRNNYNLESGPGTGYDGGVLEISINGSPFQDILAAGGSFATGGYNNTLSTSYGNPLGGRSAWTGNSGGFITTTVNLPPAAAGQPVQFKWRCGSDNGVNATGWYVDSITLSGLSCCVYSPPPQPPSLSLASATNNIFHFDLTGTPGASYVIQVSTNLAFTNWQSLLTNPAPFTFTDTNITAFPQRFFRALLAP